MSEQKETTEVTEVTPQVEEKKGKFWSEVLETLKVFCLALVVYHLINAFVLQNNIVSGPSMFPTLHDRDRIVVNRVGRMLGKKPERGDIITIKGKDVTWTDRLVVDGVSIQTDRVLHEDIIKRVVAVPGDRIQFKDGHVYLNGSLLKEPYIDDSVRTLSEDTEEITVPENSYFVLGDNREHSLDSRRIGPIPYNAIMGVVLIRVYPFNAIGTLN